MENECHVIEDESNLPSIDESSADNVSDSEYISTDDLKEIRDRNYVHPNINARHSRLKIRDQIRKAQSEWKGAVLSSKSMVKISHKLFKVTVKKLNNSLPALGESGSEVSYFIQEPRIFS